MFDTDGDERIYIDKVIKIISYSKGLENKYDFDIDEIQEVIDEININKAERLTYDQYRKCIKKCL